MSRKQYTRETIIQTLQNLAKTLNKNTLSKKDVNKIISTGTVAYHFGSLGKALEAAGLEKNPTNQNPKGTKLISDDELFKSFLEVEKKIGKIPPMYTYNAEGRYSSDTFLRRYGKWDDVISYYRKWKAGNALDPINHPTITDQPSIRQKTEPPIFNTRTVDAGMRPSQLFGELINFRGLIHAPINETGVVYLFGMISREFRFFYRGIADRFSGL
jgi:hypothetical protein